MENPSRGITLEIYMILRFTRSYRADRIFFQHYLSQRISTLVLLGNMWVISLRTVEIEAKSAISSSKGGIDAFIKGLPTRYSVNPYLGCPHCCKYCYARFITKFSKIHDTHKDFCHVIGVKQNLDVILDKELRRGRTDGSVLWIGSVTDPYNGLESRYQVTRRILQVLNRHKHPFSIYTRSPLVVRDLDLLSKDRSEVIFTFTGIRGADKRIFEPNSPASSSLLDPIEQISQKTNVRVAILPIIPTVNDDPLFLKELIRDISQRGVKNVYAGFLRLNPFTLRVLRDEISSGRLTDILSYYDKSEKHAGAYLPNPKYRLSILRQLFEYSISRGIGFYVEDPFFLYNRKPTPIDRHYYATLHDFYSSYVRTKSMDAAYSEIRQKYRVDVSLEDIRMALRHVRNPAL